MFAMSARPSIRPSVSLRLALAAVIAFQVCPAEARRLKPSEVDASVLALSAANREFALDLYGRFANQSGNFFYSPYSISTALAMTLAGAHGKTAAELTDVLHLDRGDVHEAFARLSGALTSPVESGVEFSIANRLWGQKGVSWNKEFVDICKEDYGAALGQVDFAKDPEKARQEINDWCAKETKDRIQDLLGPGTVDGLTRLVLANAMYFKGAWKEQFTEARTRDEAFFLAGGEEITTPLMAAGEVFGYFEEDEFSALEMGYEGSGLSMVVLLPKDRDGLPKLESRLDGALLDRVFHGLEHESVDVTFPRFRIESEFGLAGTLSSMGMPSAFSDSADFSGVSDRPLSIGTVVHKAFIDVDEKGTEAAAATAIALRELSAPMEWKQFVADHPFAFLIRDKGTGSILFMGRMADPRG